MIIITAITAIGTYLSLYQISYFICIWKYPMAIFASMLGLYGIVACSIFMVGHMAGLKSLGVPYLSPLAPIKKRDVMDGGLWDVDREHDHKRLKT